MIARCCTTQTCKTVSPHFTCPLCDGPTQPLPIIELGAIGLQAKASLHWTQDDHHYLQIEKASGPNCVAIEIRDIKHNTQAFLPGFNPVSGLTIMDSLRSTAALIATKSPSTWHGWILYLIEALQARTDKGHYQTVLAELRGELAAMMANDHVLEGETWTP